MDKLKKIESKSIVIYNGIEANQLQTEKSKKEDFGFKSDDIIITLVGRISRLKGHKWLLKTYINHFQKFDNVKLVFVGLLLLKNAAKVADKCCFSASTKFILFS